MTTSPLTKVIQHLRGVVLVRNGAGRTDGELLESFISGRDEAAFEALVRRHGPMVMGVCQRVIGNAHDAEDAFQATFLVLVRKAAAVVPRQAVGNWLYGVAYRTGLEARAKNIRRQAREKQVTDMPHPQVPPEGVCQELQALLDQELSRLPDKYRVPVILCELEGRTRQEVARQLGLPAGTLSSRLATARKLLAKRLAGRGLALSGGVLAAVLSQNAASAAVPAPLVVSTVQAAAQLAAGKTAAGLVSAKVAALTEGVLKAMFLTKLKMAAALVLVIGLLAVGSGLLGHRALAGTAADPAEAALDKPPTPTNLAALQRPKKEQPRDGTLVTGPLEAVDAVKRTVTISIFSRKEGESTGKTFAVAKDAKIQKDFAPAKLADLKPGGRVTLKLSADKTAVVSISLVGRTVSGEFFDAGKKTITVTVEARGGVKEKRTFPIAKDAKVTVAGKAATLGDLKEGTRVMLTFSADDENIIQIQTAAGGGRKGNE